ncbi:MAG: tetratricopeptide repeat protein [Deltaproteobacteria bacterium]|nr:tetratricopeptide repeat protein [Deltaproteobacteria bacterium]
MASTPCPLLRAIPHGLLVLFLLFLSCNVFAEQKGAAYCSFGIFAYEEGDYEGAEKNFRKALEMNPKNPDYHHYLGKTYIKTGYFNKANEELNFALRYKSKLEGLKYDMALVQYRLGAYPPAANLFKKALKENPANVLAQYYIGICMFKQNMYKEALDHFMKASQQNPSIRANGYYHAGMCHMQLNNPEKAAEMFSRAAEHAEPGDLKTNAQKWLAAARIKAKSFPEVMLYLKFGAQYDDNVALEPIDEDIVADEGDFGVTAYFSGKYRFLDRGNITSGVGYTHYQTWQFELTEYNLAGSIPGFYIKYQRQPLLFGFSYFPSFYWLDTDSYMIRQQLKTDIFWEINETLSSSFTLNYYGENNLINIGRTGQIRELLADVFYRFPDKKVLLFAGIGLNHNSTASTDYNYVGFQTNLGVVWNLPHEFVLSASGKINLKKYQYADSGYNEKRDDTKYDFASSLSRPVVYDWLRGILEYRHIRNDSGFSIYSYRSSRVSLSLSAVY